MNPLLATLLAQAAQEITSHAEYGVENGRRVRNVVSPHFDNFVQQKIRAILIGLVQVAQTEIAAKLPMMETQEEAIAAVNEILQKLYK